MTHIRTWPRHHLTKFGEDRMKTTWIRKRTLNTDWPTYRPTDRLAHTRPKKPTAGLKDVLTHKVKSTCTHQSLKVRPWKRKTNPRFALHDVHRLRVVEHGDLIIWRRWLQMLLGHTHYSATQVFWNKSKSCIKQNKFKAILAFSRTTPTDFNLTKRLSVPRPIISTR